MSIRRRSRSSGWNGRGSRQKKPLYFSVLSRSSEARKGALPSGKRGHRGARNRGVRLRGPFRLLRQIGITNRTSLWTAKKPREGFPSRAPNIFLRESLDFGQFDVDWALFLAQRTA